MDNEIAVRASEIKVGDSVINGGRVMRVESISSVRGNIRFKVSHDYDIGETMVFRNESDYIVKVNENNNGALSVKIKRLTGSEDLPLPSYGKPGDAGMDLYAAVVSSVTLYPGARHLVPTGISIALPVGYEAQVRSRSGLAIKNGVAVLNSPGTVDSSYRGEVCVILINHSNVAFTIERGMRVAQMVVAPVSHVTWEIVDTLDETERNHGGFGHTGV